eukprot:scaffold36829_cov29-Tisochrysis_lutea.AAC.3
MSEARVPFCRGGGRFGLGRGECEHCETSTTMVRQVGRRGARTLVRISRFAPRSTSTAASSARCSKAALWSGVHP